MTGKRWAALAALVFLVWNATALVVAPHGHSELASRLRPPLASYLRPAYLDHQSTFFSPRPDAGRLIRYQIVNSDGQVDERALAEAVARNSAAFSEWMRLHDRVAASGPELREYAAAYLCRHHIDFRPRGIRFVVLHQLTITHDQYLHGVRHTDPEALRRETLPEIPCA